MTTWMLDTCICSFIVRQRPLEVLERLSEEVARRNRIVISSITYAEMQYGLAAPAASRQLRRLVEEFLLRIDGILPWDARAVDETVRIHTTLSQAGRVISRNDTAIAGHAIASDCTLVSDNSREFRRVDGLKLENWVDRTPDA